MVKKIIKVGAYCRVSHDDQKKHGFSIPTQKSMINSFLAEHKEMMLVDFYIDEGIPASKIKKRLELHRLLKDIENGKIDMVIFTRLDRWGRDLSIYYKLQDILEKNNVTWQATCEDYETKTASGKFKVNIMMSVAQQEKEKCGERIKDVFEEKIKNGEAVTGATPFGWMIKEIEGKKRVVRNPEEEETLRAMIEHFKTYHSLRKTIMYAQDTFEHYPSYNCFYRILKNTFLYGAFRDNQNYCEGYMTKPEFDEIQLLLDNNLRYRNDNHTYIFSKLLKCPVCGGNLTGYCSWTTHANGNRKANLGYRCESYWFARKKSDCTFNTSKSQPKLEVAVLKNIMPMLNQYIIECEASQKKVVKKADVDKIKAEMERLNNMYLKGRISEDDYDNKYVDLNNKLMQAQATEEHISVSDELKALQGININDLYQTFSDEEKMAFFRGIVREIHIDTDYNITNIIFL